MAGTQSDQPAGGEDLAPPSPPPVPLSLIIINVLLLGAPQVVFVFIVPVVGAMAADAGQQLPLPAQLLIDWHDEMKHLECMDPVRAFFFIVIAICAWRGMPPRVYLWLLVVFQFLVLVALAACLFPPIAQLAAAPENLK